MDKTTNSTRSKNEVKQFVKKYNIKSFYDNKSFEKCTSIINSQSAVDSLVKAMINSFDFDRPDGYWYDKETSSLYIFEHFSFDCSPSIKHGGSTLRMNENKVSNEINKEIEKSQTDYSSIKVVEQGIGIKSGNTITYNMGENGDIYRNNYIENFRYGYEGHAKKKKKYIKHCIEEIKDIPKIIITTFLIEDVTKCGTYYNINKCMGEPVNLLLTKQFFEAFKNSKVDYVFFGSYQGSYFCDRSIINCASNQFVDLMSKELYILPSLLNITSATKIDIS